MAIYTRAGDRGETGLPGGRRVAKDAAVLEASGTLEELNALLGVVRAESPNDQVDRLLERLQHHLLSLSAEAAGADPALRPYRPIDASDVQFLEETIDRYDRQLAPVREFILPAGARAATGLYLALGVCRRAERRLVTLARHAEHKVSPDVMAYVNRLGDLLFVLARTVNRQAGSSETCWRKDEA